MGGTKKMIILSTDNHLITIDDLKANVVTEHLRVAVRTKFVDPEKIDTVSIKPIPVERAMSYSDLEKPEHYPIKFISNKGPNATCDVWCTISPAECAEALKVMGFDISENITNYLKHLEIPLMLRK